MNRYVRATLVLSAVLIQISVDAVEVRVRVYVSTVELDRIAINVGDAVVWEESSSSPQPSHRIVSYTGEFASPPLTNLFKYTFGEPGFYGYRVLFLPMINTRRLSVGTVTVMPWSNAPPLVTINSPVDQARFGAVRFNSTNVVTEPVPILASVNDVFGVPQRVEFYAGTNLLGMATNAPYQLPYYDTAVGTNTITVKAVGPGGQFAWSKPVTFTVEELVAPKFYAPRIVRGQILAFDYVAAPLTSYGLFRLPELGPPARDYLVMYFRHSGVFADSITNRTQFYFPHLAQ